jgi:hypothetical protein
LTVSWLQLICIEPPDWDWDAEPEPEPDFCALPEPEPELDFSALPEPELDFCSLPEPEPELDFCSLLAPLPEPVCDAEPAPEDFSADFSVVEDCAPCVFFSSAAKALAVIKAVPATNRYFSFMG